MASTLQRSAHWTILLEGDRAIASAGADQLFLLDDLDGPAARALHAAFHEGRLDELRGAALERALGDLERLGAVERARRAPASPLRCRVDGRGDGERAADALAGLLRTLGEGVVELVEQGEELLVIVRTAGTHLDRLAAYDAIRTPHLYCDLGYHHTVSLGPLVWPGETACVRCLAGRILHAWGDPAAPPRPLAAQHLPVVAALLLTSLRRLAERGSCPALTERTVSLNLDTLQTRTERVHRLPWCPTCFPPGTSHGTGSLALPWQAATAR